MIKLLSVFWKIMLRKSSPEELPGSNFLLDSTFIFFLISLPTWFWEGLFDYDLVPFIYHRYMRGPFWKSISPFHLPKVYEKGFFKIY